MITNLIKLPNNYYRCQYACKYKLSPSEYNFCLSTYLYIFVKCNKNLTPSLCVSKFGKNITSILRFTCIYAHLGDSRNWDLYGSYGQLWTDLQEIWYTDLRLYKTYFCQIPLKYNRLRY